MIEEYINSLKELSERIERMDFDIDTKLEMEIEKFISEKLQLPQIAFERKFSSFERITINKRVLPNKENTRLDRIKYLYNPPPKFIKSYGRVNLKKQSIFYATFLTPIAMKELKPEVVDIFTLSFWKLLNSYDKIRVYPVFEPEADLDMYKKFGDSDLFEKTRAAELSLMLDDFFNSHPKEDKGLIIELMKFVSSCFSKKINSENNSLYVVTANLANKILNNMFNGKIEAITYPTVQDSTKIENIAIKPRVVRKKYALNEVREYRFIGFNDDRLLSEYHGRSNKFVGSKIIWN